MDKIIGPRLRQLRDRKGLTDWQVAARLGMSCEEYRCVELGLRRLGAADLFVYVKFVGCSFRDIFTPDDMAMSNPQIRSGNVLVFTGRQRH